MKDYGFQFVKNLIMSEDRNKIILGIATLKYFAGL
jgi:hypothetical protein